MALPSPIRIGGRLEGKYPLGVRINKSGNNMKSHRISFWKFRKKKLVPVFKTRKTISSSAEFDGAHTNTRTRYLRQELTTSGFCNIFKVSKHYSWRSQIHNGTSYGSKLTKSFPEVGKKPSSPSMGIMLSLGLPPINHGDALTQWLYLQNDAGEIKKE